MQIYFNEANLFLFGWFYLTASVNLRFYRNRAEVNKTFNVSEKGETLCLFNACRGDVSLRVSLKCLASVCGSAGPDRGLF